MPHTKCFIANTDIELHVNNNQVLPFAAGALHMGRELITELVPIALALTYYIHERPAPVFLDILKILKLSRIPRTITENYCYAINRSHSDRFELQDTYMYR